MQNSLPNRELNEIRNSRSELNLFDSSNSIAHSISIDFKLAAGIAKQVRHEFPSKYAMFCSKASKGKINAQQGSLNRFIYHLLVRPKIWNEPTHNS